MKVIFCDVDGVLQVHYGEKDEFGFLFHPHFEANLRRIVEATGAKIVISSDWRKNGLGEMKRLWSHRNLAGEVIDVTVDCFQIVDMGICEFYDLVERGHEIQYYLDTNDVEQYVILDDINDMLKSQSENFVRCSKNSDHEDSYFGEGLTNKCVDKAIEILNRIKK